MLLHFYGASNKLTMESVFIIFIPINWQLQPIYKFLLVIRIRTNCDTKDTFQGK